VFGLVEVLQTPLQCLEPGLDLPDPVLDVRGGHFGPRRFQRCAALVASSIGHLVDRTAGAQRQVQWRPAFIAELRADRVIVPAECALRGMHRTSLIVKRA
jgi:hypothetical protein